MEVWLIGRNDDFIGQILEGFRDKKEQKKKNKDQKKRQVEKISTEKQKK